MFYSYTIPNLSVYNEINRHFRAYFNATKYCYLKMWSFIPLFSVYCMETRWSHELHEIIEEEIQNAMMDLGPNPKFINVKRYFFESIFRILGKFLNLDERYFLVLQLSLSDYISDILTKLEVELYLHIQERTQNIHIDFPVVGSIFPRTKWNIFWMTDGSYAIGIKYKDSKWYSQDRPAVFDKLEIFDNILELSDFNNRVIHFEYYLYDQFETFFSMNNIDLAYEFLFVNTPDGREIDPDFLDEYRLLLYKCYKNVKQNLEISNKTEKMTIEKNSLIGISGPNRKMRHIIKRNHPEKKDHARTLTSQSLPENLNESNTYVDIKSKLDSIFGKLPKAWDDIPETKTQKIEPLYDDDLPQDTDDIYIPPIKFQSVDPLITPVDEDFEKIPEIGDRPISPISEENIDDRLLYLPDVPEIPDSIDNNTGSDDTSSESQSEESEDQDGSIDEEFLAKEDSNIDNCCWVPDKLNIDNTKVLIAYYDQFKDRKPKSECLLQALEIINKYLLLLNESNLIPGKTFTIINAISNLRHDIFAYWFLSIVMGLDVNFSTDMRFPQEADSVRTPDFIDVKGSEIKIYEFTVVANILTANFTKGTNKFNSKYKNEIVRLESKGFTVFYYPIVISNNSDVEKNKVLWSNLGFETTEEFDRLIDKFLSLMDPKFNFLYQMQFDKYYDQDGTTNVVDNESWNYRIVYINKARFFEIWYYIKRYELVPENHYLFNFSKKFTLREIMPSSLTLSGSEIIKMRDDQLKLWNYVQDKVRGKEKVTLSGVNTFDEVDDLTFDHGLKKDTEPYYDPRYINNFLKNDNFTLRQVENNINNLWKLPRSELTTELDFESLKESIKIYKKDRKKWLYEDTTVTPPIYNNPRRSFVNMFDSECSSIIEYGKPIIPNILEGTLSLKIALTKIPYIDFESKKEESFIQIDKDDYNRLNKEIFLFLKEKGLSNMSHKKARAHLYGDDLNNFNNLRLSLKHNQTKYIRNVRKNKSGIIRINSDEQKAIRNDMNWISNSSYKLSMVQRSNLEDLSILMFSGSKLLDFKIHKGDSVDIDFFNRMKQATYDRMDKYMIELSHTKLSSWSHFHSRLCYTLLAVSNKSFNKNFLYLDNLGLKNVLLIVKGGGKMSTTRKSKLFKLIYPVVPEALNWQNRSRLFSSNGIFFEETSWIQLHQNEMLDGLALPTKIINNYCYLRENNEKQHAFDQLFIPSALALCNRRSLEKNLHNMRYLIVNAIGVFSQVGKMLEEFAKPAYTNLELCIYNNLSTNYLSYAESVSEWSKIGSNDSQSFITKKVKHPYLNRNIINIQDLTYIIYSTYMMSKGNYNQTIEQMLNLKSIIDTHDYYLTNLTRMKVQETFTTAEDLYSNDFNFSTVTSYSVGKILSAELRQKHSISHLHTNYFRVMNDSIDTMANNRGLRYKGKDFFGHKGYYVVYKHIFDNNLDQVLNIIHSDLTDGKKYNELFKLNDSFKNTQENYELDQVIFHVVDKSQRGGGREIYVMDFVTKLYQNPIEKMFRKICEFIDNEIITIPSGKRNSAIYKQNFEFRDDKYTTFYLSYDCRKWAPRNNPDKYLSMLDGMRSVLPNEFIDSVFFYFGKHKCKQIHTRKKIAENLHVDEFFTFDEEKQSAFFVMPYSFVMGIFNMLSSLYHAGIQLLAKKYIEEKNFKLGIKSELNMMAHSDDSAGRLSYLLDDNEATKMAVKDLTFYQHLQKSGNHLMSTKKCNTSKSYFELLSTLFINHEFMPVLPKFLSNFSSIFSGKGISVDFKQIISKSIELLSNGADCSTAYMSQLNMSQFYRNFYRVNTDFGIPAFGGFADSWPALYLAFGSAADEIRISLLNPNLYKKIINFAMNNLDFDMENGTINLKMKNILRRPKAYEDFKKMVQLPDFEDNQWFFQNNKTRHSKLNVFWFRAMLDNNDFSVSLLNVNEARRYLDTLYMASGKNIILKNGLANINDILLNILSVKTEDSHYFDYMKMLYKPMIELYENIDTTGEFNFISRIPQGLKPCTLTIDNFTNIPITDINSMHLATHICRPELVKYLYSRKSYNLELGIMKEYLQKLNIPLDIKLVKSFLDFAASNRKNNFNVYSDVSKKKRIFKNDEGLVDFIKMTYSSNQILKTSRNYRNRTKVYDLDISDEIISRVGLGYLYSISNSIVDEDIRHLPLTYKNKKILLKDAYTVETNALGRGSQFINLIGHFEESIIDLSNYSNWAFWLDRQIKIGDDWVGDGKLLISIGLKKYILNIRNDLVLSAIGDHMDEVIFDTPSVNFIQKLFENMGLRLSIVDVKMSNLKYLGYSEANNFGSLHHNNVMVGCPILPWENDKLDDLQYAYRYESGGHFIRYNSYWARLHTLDSLVIKLHGLNIFNLLNLDDLSNESQSRLIYRILGGSYGLTNDINFFKEDILNDIRSTDLYKLIYNKIIINKETISNVFWNDMVNNIITEEDFMPKLYESTGLNELQKLLPQEKKDTLLLYKYYDETRDDVFNVINKLSAIEDYNKKIEAYSSIILNLKDSDGLTKLPDIGDPDFFRFWVYDNNISAAYWINAVDDLIEAMTGSFKYLKNNKQQKICNHIKGDLTNYYLQKAFFKKITVAAVHNTDFIALDYDQMIVHATLDEIFDDRRSFSEFTRLLRKTSLNNVPRHPRYRLDWHCLLANMFKYFRLSNFEDDVIDLLPASYIRKERLIDVKVDNNKPEPTPFGVMFGLYYKNELPFDSYICHINDLNKFDTSLTGLQNDKSLVEDYVDDLDVTFDYERQSQYREIFEPTKRLEKPKAGFAYSSEYYMPLRQVFKDNNKYIYNINPDVASNKGFRTSDFKFENYCYKKYLKAYLIQIEIKETVPQNISIDLDLSLSEKNFSRIFDLHRPETYDEKLYLRLIQKYDLSSHSKQLIKTIISSEAMPLFKASQIRSIIRGSTNKSSSFNEMIQQVLKNQSLNLSFELDTGVNRRDDIANLLISVKDKTGLIYNSTSLKIEYKQFKALFGGSFDDIIAGNIKMPEHKLKSFSNMIKIMIKHYKSIKSPNETSILRTLSSLLTSVKIGSLNPEGEILESLIHDYLSKLRFEETDEEDISEIDEPTTAIGKFRIKIGDNR
nr:MAG: putative RNA-dependent RNA polymerase [Trichoderma gamsii mycobunyavirus 1]